MTLRPVVLSALAKDGKPRSLLCKEAWGYDPSETYLKFNEDNAGSIFVCGGFCVWICAEFKWMNTIITPLDLNGQSTTDTNDEAPRLIAQLHLETTLTGDGDNLTDEAFRPKFFNVGIEDGYFATPVDPSQPLATSAHEQSWTKRLVFDNSPFPPASEWKVDAYWGSCDPEGSNCWDDKEFVAYYSLKPKHLDT
ncbi:hypothetical protein EJ08DRAFT_732719 [Tothia fuscella]|uniref:Uncharacterized protein n=1 Tax=Tothia fuscella TaxID=1048955 RepID=A0A9P4TZT0_9PEZI|nr:hypothetical protein EJ08DRAFT_732719 [Tothia fuscella]